MKYLILAALIFWNVSFARPNNHPWLKCDSESDCILVPAPCGGVDTVHKKFRYAYRDSTQGDRANCPKRVQASGLESPICDDGRCEVIRPKAP